MIGRVPVPHLAPADFARVLHARRPARSKVILEVLILTACRSGEVRGICREELDLDQGIWTIPSERMKAKVAHRVPLSPYLVQLLERGLSAVDPVETSLVFPTT